MAHVMQSLIITYSQFDCEDQWYIHVHVFHSSPSSTEHYPIVLPHQVSKRGVVYVCHEAYGCSLLSVIQEHLVQCGHCKHHSIGKPEEGEEGSGCNLADSQSVYTAVLTKPQRVMKSCMSITQFQNCYACKLEIFKLCSAILKLHKFAKCTEHN